MRGSRHAKCLRGNEAVLLGGDGKPVLLDIFALVVVGGGRIGILARFPTLDECHAAGREFLGARAQRDYFCLSATAMVAAR